MSQEDSLTLGARIKDEFSGPVREMGKAWKEFSDKLKHGHEEGVKHAKLHGKEVEGLAEKFKGMRRELMEGIGPALEELGIGLIGVGGPIAAAGAGIAGVVTVLKSAAESFNVFKDASIRAGTSVDFLQSMSTTIANLTGEDTGQAVQNLADVNEQLARLTRGRPDTINAWKSAYAGLYETLGQDLKGKTVPEALETVMKWKEAHPEIALDKVRDVFKLIGFDQRLATVTLKEFREENEKNVRSQREHPYDTEAVKALDTAFKDLKRTIGEISADIVSAFGPEAAVLLKSLGDQIHQEVEDIKWIVDMINYARLRKSPSTNEDYGKGYSDYGPTGRSGIDDKAYKDVPSFSEFMKKLLTAPIIGGHASPISFTTGGGEAESLFTRSVHSGTLAALQDWYAALSGKHGGIVPASYTPEGSGPSGGLHSGGGYSLLHGGGGHRALAKHLGIDQGPMPGGADNTAGGGGDASGGGQVGGSWDRSRFAKELADNPALRDRLKSIAAAEDDPSGASGTLANQAIMETMMNRATVRGTSLAAQLKLVSEDAKRGYYPTMRGYGARKGAVMDENLAKVLAGSNVSGNATDNSSSWLAAKEKRTGSFRWLKDINGESFFAPGLRNPDQAAEWDRLQSTQKRDLLSRLPIANGGGMNHTVTGDAHLKVDLNGFPKGTRTDLTYGGLFTQYTLSRGMQMEESERK